MHKLALRLWATKCADWQSEAAKQGSTVPSCWAAPPTNRRKPAKLWQRRAPSVPAPAGVNPGWSPTHSSPAEMAEGLPRGLCHGCDTSMASTSSTEVLIARWINLARSSGYKPECSVSAPPTGTDGWSPEQRTCCPRSARDKDASFVQMPHALQRGISRVFPTTDFSPIAQPLTLCRVIPYFSAN